MSHKEPTKTTYIVIIDHSVNLNCTTINITFRTLTACSTCWSLAIATLGLRRSISAAEFTEMSNRMQNNETNMFFKIYQTSWNVVFNVNVYMYHILWIFLLLTKKFWYTTTLLWYVNSVVPVLSSYSYRTFTLMSKRITKCPKNQSPCTHYRVWT